MKQIIINLLIIATYSNILIQTNGLSEIQSFQMKLVSSNNNRTKNIKFRKLMNPADSSSFSKTKTSTFQQQQDENNKEKTNEQPTYVSNILNSIGRVIKYICQWIFSFIHQIVSYPFLKSMSIVKWKNEETASAFQNPFEKNKKLDLVTTQDVDSIEDLKPNQGIYMEIEKYEMLERFKINFCIDVLVDDENCEISFQQMENRIPFSLKANTIELNLNSLGVYPKYRKSTFKYSNEEKYQLGGCFPIDKTLQNNNEKIDPDKKHLFGFFFSSKPIHENGNQERPMGRKIFSEQKGNIFSEMKEKFYSSLEISEEIKCNPKIRILIKQWKRPQLNEYYIPNQ